MPVPSVEIWPAIVLLLVAAIVGVLFGVYELRSERRVGTTGTVTSMGRDRQERDLRRAA